MKSYLAHSTYANPFTHLPLYANVIWDAFITYFDAFSALTWGGERELKDLMLWAINNPSCTPETWEVSFKKNCDGQHSRGKTQRAAPKGHHSWYPALTVIALKTWHSRYLHSGPSTWCTTALQVQHSRSAYLSERRVIFHVLQKYFAGLFHCPHLRLEHSIFLL